MEACLRRSIVQLDLLKPGETYSIKVNAGKHSRDEDMELVECYKDHYLFINSKGFKESLLKTDLFSGTWEIKGFNPREKLLAAAGKMQEAEEAKREVDTKSEIEEEVERIVNANIMKMAGEVTRWLEENPNQEGDVRDIISEFDPSQYYVDKVREAVAKKLKGEGKDIVVTDGRPKKLILRVEEVVDQKEECQDVASLFEAGIVKKHYINQGENEDRKFLIEKAEELQVRITDAEERLEMIQARLTAEIGIYQELLEEIQEHLER